LWLTNHFSLIGGGGFSKEIDGLDGLDWLHWIACIAWLDRSNVSGSFFGPPALGPQWFPGGPDLLRSPFFPIFKKGSRHQGGLFLKTWPAGRENLLADKKAPRERGVQNPQSWALLFTSRPGGNQAGEKNRFSAHNQDTAGEEEETPQGYKGPEFMAE